MAVQGNVGKPGAATPTGEFTIYNKDKHRRRQSEPDRGYPMAYWCEFAPAYGFHEGFVHPAPHTHGCVRLHREAAARLFALVRIGTKVHIANSLPEDKKWGSQVTRLDQSKLTLERPATDITALAEHLVTSFTARTTRHRIVLTSEREVIADVDPESIEQVLSNLLDNALKYSPEGGRVCVEIGHIDENTIFIAGRDYGIGISPERRGSIFERF